MRICFKTEITAFIEVDEVSDEILHALKSNLGGDRILQMIEEKDPSARWQRDDNSEVELQPSEKNMNKATVWVQDNGWNVLWNNAPEITRYYFVNINEQLGERCLSYRRSINVPAGEDIDKLIIREIIEDEFGAEKEDDEYYWTSSQTILTYDYKEVSKLEFENYNALLKNFY